LCAQCAEGLEQSRCYSSRRAAHSVSSNWFWCRRSSLDRYRDL